MSPWLRSPTTRASYCYCFDMSTMLLLRSTFTSKGTPPLGPPPTCSPGTSSGKSPGLMWCLRRPASPSPARRYVHCAPARRYVHCARRVFFFFCRYSELDRYDAPPRLFVGDAFFTRCSSVFGLSRSACITLGRLVTPFLPRKTACAHSTNCH